MNLKELIGAKKHLVLVGVTEPIEALIVKAAGFKAAYISGAALSTKLGFLDEGLISLEKMVQVVSDIIKASDLPLLVDCDTGLWSSDSEDFQKKESPEAQKEMAHAMMHLLADAGADAVQIEDQAPAKKRCGHLSGKELVSMNDMFWKIKMLAYWRKNRDQVIVARTDARAVEGLDGAIFRAHRYINAGADAIFPEALESLEEFIEFRKAVDSVPLVANLTTHGKTPSSISAEHLFGAGYQIVLLPVPQRILFKKFEEILKEARHYGSLTAPVMRGEMSSRDQINDFIKKNSKVYKKTAG